MKKYKKNRIIIFLIAICLLIIGCESNQSENSESTAISQEPHNNTVSQNTNTDNYLTPLDDFDIPEETWNVDENTIIWAFMDNLAAGTDDVEEKVNKKLEEDGYDFRLKCVVLGYRDYSKKIRECKADIVFGGINSDLDTDVKWNPTYDAICAGSFLKLDDYLKGSKLYDFFPEVLWDSVKYNENIYCVPNMNFYDTHLAVIIKKSAYTEEQMEQFDGSPEGLLKLVSDENKLYYNSRRASFLDIYGISNEDSYGIYYDSEDIKNIMDLELTSSWLKALHELAMQDRIVDGSVAILDCKDEWSVALYNVGADSGFNENDYMIINYAGDVYPHYSGAIAIKKDSHNPDAAFKMIELFLTESD